MGTTIVYCGRAREDVRRGVHQTGLQPVRFRDPSPHCLLSMSFTQHGWECQSRCIPVDWQAPPGSQALHHVCAC